MYREDYEEHNADGDYFFLPDLARCHYANETQDDFNKLEVPFIPRGSNPLSLLNFAQFKRFWGILKAKVYDGGWEAKTFRMLRQRIR